MVKIDSYLYLSDPYALTNCILNNLHSFLCTFLQLIKMSSKVGLTHHK